MLIGKLSPFVTAFIETLNEAIEKHEPGSSLSRTQKYWISFCIMAIFITNTVCQAKAERAGMGQYSKSALSWMFRHSKITWELLLNMSVRVILRRYGITKGALALDDTDKKRSKSAKKISLVHKLKDKLSGGFINGQCIVFLVLVTPAITIPVGFKFYMPDPELTEWNKLNKKLKKQGVPPKERPPKPEKNEKYPTKQELALSLLEQFKHYHPYIKVQTILGDNLYGSGEFIDKASNIFDGVQTISKLRKDQNIRFKGKEQAIEKYFKNRKGTNFKIRIRGGKEVTVTVISARLHVCSHGKKRFVIALKYEGETEYRYLDASDLSWRTLDIIQAFTLRWLVEVFIQDWKSYEGWGNLTKQTGEEGSSRSLILSLLADLCSFFHPEQLARIESKLPACTVGSLQARIKADCMLDIIRDLLASDNPEKKFDLLSKSLHDFFKLAPSKKHMVNKDLGRLEPTPSLKYKNVQIMA